MSVQYIDIKIFGKSLKVSCPNECSEDLQTAARYLNQRLQDLKVKTKVSNTEQLIFVTALNISYELENEKAKINKIILKLEAIISKLKKIKTIKKK
ncbi:MAG: cell division protein ZapA [Buchnera aphidicola (Floraphis choui)]